MATASPLLAGDVLVATSVGEVVAVSVVLVALLGFSSGVSSSSVALSVVVAADSLSDRTSVTSAGSGCAASVSCDSSSAAVSASLSSLVVALFTNAKRSTKFANANWNCVPSRRKTVVVALEVLWVVSASGGVTGTVVVAIVGSELVAVSGSATGTGASSVLLATGCSSAGSTTSSASADSPSGSCTGSVVLALEVAVSSVACGGVFRRSVSTRRTFGSSGKYAELIVLKSWYNASPERFWLRMVSTFSQPLLITVPGNTLTVDTVTELRSNHCAYTTEASNKRPTTTAA